MPISSTCWRYALITFRCALTYPFPRTTIASYASRGGVPSCAPLRGACPLLYATPRDKHSRRRIYWHLTRLYFLACLVTAQHCLNTRAAAHYSF